MKQSNIKEFTKLYSKEILTSFCLCLLVLLIWLIPFKASNVSVQFVTDGTSIDEEAFEVNIYSTNAYEDLYASKGIFGENNVTFNIPKDYWPIDSIFVTDDKFANSVTGIVILPHGLYASDYISASYSGNIWEKTDEGYFLNKDAMKTIERGKANPWKSKAYASIFIADILAAYILYIFIKKRSSKFKACVSVCIFLSFHFALWNFYTSYLFKKPIEFFGYYVHNNILIIPIMLVLSFLLVLMLFCDKENQTSKRVIIVIYILATVFSAGKMVYYAKNVGNTPDEANHIAYVAYFEQSGKIIPDFEDAPAAKFIDSDNSTAYAEFKHNSINNLIHPPLYYQIMRLSNAFKFNNDGTFIVNLNRMRGLSIMIALVAIVLMFYIGYKRLRNIPIIHLLYAMIIVSVPMLTYVASGVNNDTLTLLTVTIFIGGILRYCDKKRNVLTYLLIALGITSTVLTKLTAGILVALAALIVLAVSLIREKCYKDLLSWQFLITLPIYLIAVVYYLAIFAKYGAFQPALHTLNEEFAWTTVFYVRAPERIVKSFPEYFHHFFSQFFSTWTAIHSHISVPKSSITNFFETAALGIIWFFPLALFLKKVRKNLHHSKVIIAVYISVLTTLFIQFINGYTGFLNRGYLGGFQSRYYLCAISIFALAAAMILQKIFSYTDCNNRYAKLIRKVTVCATISYIGLLAYEDFIYFLLHCS